MENLTTVRKRPRFYAHKWPMKNMKFLYDFLIKQNMSITELSKEIDVQPATIRRWFERDNVRLSQVISLLNQLGYEIQFSYDIKHSLSENINITLLEKDTVDKSPLYFIDKAMAEENITLMEFSEKINMTQPGVSKWFKKQDIFVKYIYQIAEALDWKVSVTIKPLSDVKAD